MTVLGAHSLAGIAVADCKHAQFLANFDVLTLWRVEGRLTPLATPPLLLTSVVVRLSWASAVQSPPQIDDAALEVVHGIVS